MFSVQPYIILRVDDIPFCAMAISTKAEYQLIFFPESDGVGFSLSRLTARVEMSVPPVDLHAGLPSAILTDGVDGAIKFAKRL